MDKWNKLSMKDKAKYIKLAVDSGITNLNIIRDTYNKFDEGGPKEDRTDHPIELTRNIQQALDLADFTDRINHIDPNIGEYNPFYQASDNTYGIVPLPEVQITAPMTKRARNNIEARRGMHYMQQGLEDAAKVVAPIVAGAALPAIASTGALGTITDLASIVIDPTNPFDYLPYVGNLSKMVSKAANNPALLPIYELGSKALHPIYVYKRNQKVKQMENMIDKVNKWGARYKYSKIPKSSAKNPEIAEELIKQRLVEHNTFTRGVRDDLKHREALNTLARKHFNLSDNIEPSRVQRLQVAATYYAPKTGSGRAGFHQNYEGEGSLYTSNSLGTAKAYATPNHIGEDMGLVAILNRPIDFNQPMNTWLLQADIPFMNNSKSLIYSTKELPYLNKTGQSINSFINSFTKLDIPYKQIKEDVYKKFLEEANSVYNKNIDALENIKNKLLNKNYPINDFYIPPRYDDFKFIGPDIMSTHPKLKYIADKYESTLYKLRNIAYSEAYRNGFKSDEVLDLINNYNKYARYVYSEKFYPLGKSVFNKELNKAYNKEIQKAIIYPKDIDKRNFLNTLNINNPYVSQIHSNTRPKGSSNMITTEHMKTSTRGQQDAYQHFIFTGPENTQALDLIKFINPESIDLNNFTRSHVGKSSYGLSRKSK